MKFFTNAELSYQVNGPGTLILNVHALRNSHQAIISETLSIVAHPISAEDLKSIYAIRDLLTADLTAPLNLTSLATRANMSVSKLNRLLKQVFGTTVGNFHQKLRIHQAADLIRNKQYSVTAAGYEVGFSNLSHFARIFEKHTGLKPKKFSSALLQQENGPCPLK